MTAKTLEQEVSLACECYYREKRYITAFEVQCFKHGYIAAASLRDKEIEELRAKVAELEERAAQWVPESGLKSLMDQGWTEFYNDKRGNEPRLWLMVPPIPLPEGEK